MRYEIVREWDASRFMGRGKVGMIERETPLSIGETLTPQPGEYKDELQRELLSGTIEALLPQSAGAGSAGESSNFDFQAGLDGLVDVPELSKRYDLTEERIISHYLGHTSEIRGQLLAEHPGKALLMDDLYSTNDHGEIGVLWFSGGDFIIYHPEKGQILLRQSPGLGARYGTCGKRDFLTSIYGRKERKGLLALEDIFDAFREIKDYDYYHWEDD